MTFVPHLRMLAAVAAVTSAGLSGARSEDVSHWVQDTHSRLRLLAGSRSGAVVLAGVEIQLDAGWKTYWRTPGDSGVPPRFDFSRSDNVESVAALFPAPVNFPDGAGGTSFGYSRRVTFPLRIVPKDGTKPVTLRATVHYAVCEKLCVPVEADAELVIAGAVSAQDGALALALASVPKPARIGDSGPLAIRSVVRENGRVVVNAAAPETGTTKLFVEGPTPDWSLPSPKQLDRPGPGTIRFVFGLDGLPPGAKADGARLTLTLAGPDSAYEYAVVLD